MNVFLHTDEINEQFVRQNLKNRGFGLVIICAFQWRYPLNVDRLSEKLHKWENKMQNFKAK